MRYRLKTVNRRHVRFYPFCDRLPWFRDAICGRRATITPCPGMKKGSDKNGVVKVCIKFVLTTLRLLPTRNSEHLDDSLIADDIVCTITHRAFHFESRFLPFVYF